MSLLSKRRSKKGIPDPMLQHSSFADSSDGPRRKRRSKYDGQAMSFRIPESEIRNRPTGLRRFVRTIWHLVLLAIALGVCAAIAFIALTYSNGSKNYHEGKTVIVTIPNDANGAKISQILFDDGVVKSKSTFSLRLRISGKAPTLRAGTYKLKSGAKFDVIVATLQKGPAAAPTFNIQFPEGFRNTEMAARIDSDQSARLKDGGLQLPKFTGREYLNVVRAMRVPSIYGAPKGTKSMEGFLFPATYELRNTDGAQALANKQFAAMQENLKSLDLTYAKAHNLTTYEVVIIASMVEREARVAEERPLVAAVIYNRLRLRMTLGIDATIQYAVDPNQWKKELLQSDLEIDSPYNTRLRVGLPPTPIANPGLSSLIAAAKPARTEDLYYVALKDGSGKHFFTDNYDEFLAHA